MGNFFERVAIAGVGLIGGSLGAALKRAGFAGKIVGTDARPEALDEARARGLIDVAGDFENCFEGADLGIIAAPVVASLDLLRRTAALKRRPAILTDVGSVKAPIVREAERLLGEVAPFVGGHPMAGSEKTGPSAAREDLFEGCRWLLTPGRRTPREVVERMKKLFEAIGCRVSLLDAETHDEIMALLSHLPHAVAYSLMGAVLSEEGRARVRYAAGGLRDYTRIAASDPVMWRDIFLANRDNVLGALDRYGREMATLRSLIERRDGEGLLDYLRNVKTGTEEAFASAEPDSGEGETG